VTIGLPVRVNAVVPAEHCVVKLALWVRLDGEPRSLDETMEQAERQEAVAAWRDAIRLAGLPEGLGTRASNESLREKQPREAA
jgi:hypothetical protein